MKLGVIIFLTWVSIRKKQKRSYKKPKLTYGFDFPCSGACGGTKWEARRMPRSLISRPNTVSTGYGKPLYDQGEISAAIIFLSRYDPMTDVREITLTPRTKTIQTKEARMFTKKHHETQCNRNHLGTTWEWLQGFVHAILAQGPCWSPLYRSNATRGRVVGLETCVPR